MDNQILFNIVVAVAGTACGWIIRIMWEALSGLRKDMREIEQQLPNTYVRRDDWRDQMTRIEDMLGKIFDRLEAKADK
jgi:hypothetical protein